VQILKYIDVEISFATAPFHDYFMKKNSIKDLPVIAKTAKPFVLDTAPAKLGVITVELSRTKLGTFPLLLLGGIIENQNSDFVMQ
jgi:hypothetical protein